MLLAGVCCAVVLTAALLLFDWNSSPESESFVKNVPFLIWAVLLCSQTALWTLLAIPLWRSLRGLVADYRFDRGIAARLAISVAVVAFLVAVFVGFSVPVVPDYPFAHHRAKILTLTAGGFLVALVAMIGIWLVEAASTQLLLAPRERQLPEYLRLRADLRRFLGAAAAIIGAATLSTGGLRSAILSNVKGVEFPAEYVLYYGAYFSVVLLLAYAPAYLAFRDVGRHLLESLLPIPSDAPDSWADWYADRKALEGLLELDVATSKALQSGLAIATPFVGSAIGVLLGTRG